MEVDSDAVRVGLAAWTADTCAARLGRIVGRTGAASATATGFAALGRSAVTGFDGGAVFGTDCAPRSVGAAVTGRDASATFAAAGAGETAATGFAAARTAVNGGTPRAMRGFGAPCAAVTATDLGALPAAAGECRVLAGACAAAASGAPDAM